MTWDDIPDGLKHFVDVLSVTTLLGTLSQMLPHIAAALTIVWTCIRILETETIRNLRKKRKKTDDGPA